MDHCPPLTEPKLGAGLDWAIKAVLDYKEMVDHDDHLFPRDLLEGHIWEGFFGYVKTGISLKNMARYRRYEKVCKSMKQYCQKFLHISEGYAKKIIEAADVWLELVDAGFKVLPNCVSQAIPLIKFNVVDLDGNHLLLDKWREVIDRAAGTGKRITSTLVKEVVDKKEAPRRMEIDNDLWELINEQSAKAGVSKKDFVRRAIEQYLSGGSGTRARSPEEESETEVDAEADAEAQQAWREDLQNLIEEHEAENPAPVEDEGLEEPVSMLPLLPVSPPPPIDGQSKLAISFGQTLEPLLRGIKTVTRREWKLSEVEKFCKVFEQGKWVRALDKAYFRGGKQIGWLRLTKKPYQEELSRVSQTDCDAEGYPELSPRQLLNRFFGGKSDRSVWVLEFEFRRC